MTEDEHPEIGCKGAQYEEGGQEGAGLLNGEVSEYE
jgi:hypothetical protein